MCDSVEVRPDAMLSLEPRHQCLMFALLCFADKNGRVVDTSLRQIAERAKQPLSTVGRNLQEMRTLHHFTRSPGALTTLPCTYQLSERFFVKSSPINGTRDNRGAAPRSHSYQQTGSPTGGTQENPRTRFSDSKEQGELGRSAPYDDIDDRAIEAKAALSGKTRDQVVRDQKAYDESVRDQRRQSWLNGLEMCAGDLYAGTPRGLELTELIQQARQAGHAGKDPAVKRQLDKFDREIYRPWRAEQAARQRERKEGKRKWYADRAARCAA
jgi:hypothetical protein